MSCDWSNSETPECKLPQDRSKEKTEGRSAQNEKINLSEYRDSLFRKHNKRRKISETAFSRLRIIFSMMTWRFEDLQFQNLRTEKHKQCEANTPNNVASNDLQLNMHGSFSCLNTSYIQYFLNIVNITYTVYDAITTEQCTHLHIGYSGHMTNFLRQGPTGPLV